MTDFGYGWEADLILPKGETVDKEEYYLIPNDHFENAFEKTGCEIFQHDSTPLHTAKCIKSWSQDCGTEWIPDAGNSPNLLPIENLWAISKSKIKESDMLTIPKFKADL